MYRVLGKSEEAAGSLGIKTLKTQMIVVLVSGALCGLGRAVLSMGQVTLFSENMSSGRGYIAMASAVWARISRYSLSPPACFRVLSGNRSIAAECYSFSADIDNSLYCDGGGIVDFWK